jgi:enoyl-CoA hydratase
MLVDSKLFAQIREFLVDPQEVTVQVADEWPPLALIDLDTCVATTSLGVLPPYPVIGIGDGSHPLAISLDAVLEPPIEVASITNQCQRVPRTAAIVVQLLRSIEGLPAQRALTLESFCYGLLQGGEEYRTWLKSRPPSGGPSPSGNVIVNREDDVLHIKLDRPWAHNAMDRQLRDDISNAFMLAVVDKDIRSIKWRGAGASFCSGGDLREFGAIDPTTAHLIRSRTLPAIAIARCADILDVHAQGGCIGAGLEMAAFASRFVATKDAWFQLPEIGMGLLPGAGGCVSIPRRIGRQRATLLMLSGQRIDAKTALSWGLIDDIADF